MGGYEDFNMVDHGTGTPAAGVCHARGVNEGLPPQWLIYIAVENLEEAKRRCEELGGTVLRSSESMCVIQDPAGAVAALIPATAPPGSDPE